jgi:Putative beta-barrel porin-2, OmpL-like. bbp2
MTKFLASGISKFGVIFVALMILQSACFAQNVGGTNASVPAQPAATGSQPAPVPAEVLKELDAMKARIAELEALVKSMKAQDAASAAPLVNGMPAALDSGATAAAGQPSMNSATTTSAIPPAGSPASVSSTLSVQAAADKKPAQADPFTFADFTWLNGNSRTHDSPLATKFFTPEFRADVSYIYDFHHPQDHTLVGTTESGRTGEISLQQLGVGGDFNVGNVRGRLMTQFGLYSTMTPRNDATSTGVGQWNLDGAYRYLSEAYGGYHFNALHGINVDAGIFMSYIGLFSYYNFDNWAYQPSYVSSNTPWFFTGVRTQIFLSEKLKIEPWFINGWQTYGKPNGRPGIGGQIKWAPNGWLTIISNNYGVGSDDVGFPTRRRIHTDDSIEVKYYDNKENFFDKAAFTVTFDLGCEYGGGVSCYGNHAGGPKQSFVGGMFYNRVWFHHDLFALTIGGGAMNNPGRYLTLLPPINGATEFSGTPYFTQNPGDKFKAWDATVTFDYMPKDYITFRWEVDRRASSVPYFAGPGGVTPTCPTAPTVLNICGTPGSVVPGFTPDLRSSETRINMALLVKF